jgi:hypothetical protein
VGCDGAEEKEAEPPGCGFVPVARVVGLVGDDVASTARGSVAGLRSRHRPVSCRTVVAGHPERYLALTARYHPEPFVLPRRGCSAGWVYAGTPEKFTPACQQSASGRSTTTLIVRWQPYLMRVTIGRSDRDWGGDPERALAMTRLLAQRLGVSEAAGDG